MGGGSLRMRSVVVVPLRMQAIVEALPLPKEPQGRTDPLGSSWRAILALNPDSTVFGEARTDEELKRIPRDVKVRFVLLEDDKGPVLRWSYAGSAERLDELRGALGGIFHMHLERGDGGGRAIEGYLERRRRKVVLMP